MDEIHWRLLGAAHDFILSGSAKISPSYNNSHLDHCRFTALNTEPVVHLGLPRIENTLNEMKQDGMEQVEIDVGQIPLGLFDTLDSESSLKQCP